MHSENISELSDFYTFATYWYQTDMLTHTVTTHNKQKSCFSHFSQNKLKKKQKCAACGVKTPQFRLI